ncbi:MAG: pyrroline-5-carboxylate reductase [Acidobacteria bacterium]|nr:pyrroline-5-carboxylate reductase [Acidobacteriota bacterium]MDW7983397.1 pyrroline-5-carboxylate reductase [Acidobacteriota bacterium]
MLQDKRIAVIGVGKIGGALIAGLLQSGMVRRDAIVGSTGHAETARRAAQTYEIPILTDNRALVRGRDILILAVKPQTIRKVVAEVRDLITPDQLVVTLAAATPTARIEEILERPVPVVRAMPNMPCLVQKGMTVLCPGRYAQETHVQTACALFRPLGRVEVIDSEDLMDAVTALSGSGPAYAYIIIESLAEGGVKVGLPRDLATTLAAQSLLGAAAMVLETREHPARLKDEVTTPAGVTIDGIMELEDGGLRVTLIKAVDRATRKSKELSRAH